MTDRSVPAAVLVVEDHKLLAEHAKMMLEDLGVTSVRTAAGVSDAFSQLSETTFDLAILDLDLNGENGLIIADHCREHGIPVVIATGHGAPMLPVTDRSERLLIKPYKLSDLQEAVLEVKGS